MERLSPGFAELPDEDPCYSYLGYEEFELDYPSEYIIAVEGCHDKVMGAESGVITMLRFKTNKRTSPPFGLESTSSFIFEKEGHKIIGFHGKASTLLHQIGVHVAPIVALTKSELQGGITGGEYWDDGPNYDGVRNVYVTFTKTHIRSMNINYDQDGQVVTSYHGMKNGETQEFAVDFPNEYMTSVEGTYNHIHEGNYLVLTSLTFKTSKGRVSQTFGLVTGTKFVFESQGNAIIGFHGRDGGSFDAIGVYFSPMISS